MEILLLQIFLVVDIFAIGVVVTVAIQHARAHYKPELQEPKRSASAPLVAPIELPPNVKAGLVKEAESNFLAVLNSSIGGLEHDLRSTAVNLNKKFEQIGADISDGEKERYTNMLEVLRQQTYAALSAAQAEINQHQADLKDRLDKVEAAARTKLGEEVAAEQQRLIQQIDTKLGDAMASFLTEAMQHNVDLGAQATYLTSLLDEHKDDIKREVQDGNTPAAK